MRQGSDLIKEWMQPHFFKIGIPPPTNLNNPNVYLVVSILLLSDIWAMRASDDNSRDHLFVWSVGLCVYAVYSVPYLSLSNLDGQSASV